MPVNVKLLKKVRKLIAEEPKRLEMSKWGIRYTKEEAAERPGLPSCRTVACLAGHIILATKPKRSWADLFTKIGSFKDEDGVPKRAARLIGIDADYCPFHEMNWGKREVLAWIDRQIDAASK